MADDDRAKSCFDTLNKTLYFLSTKKDFSIFIDDRTIHVKSWNVGTKLWMLNQSNMK